SGGPPPALPTTARRRGKNLASPAAAARTTWPMVRALLKLGIPTRRSPSSISASLAATEASRGGFTGRILRRWRLLPDGGEHRLVPARGSGGGCALRGGGRGVEGGGDGASGTGGEDRVVGGAEQTEVVARVPEADGRGRAEERQHLAHRAALVELARQVVEAAPADDLEPPALRGLADDVLAARIEQERLRVLAVARALDGVLGQAREVVPLPPAEA